MPRSGRDFDGRSSKTSLSTVKMSSGLTGFGQRSSSIPGADDASGNRQALDEQPHRDRRRMPATRGEPAEKGSRPVRFVQMERLRVEFAREALDVPRSRPGGWPTRKRRRRSGLRDRVASSWEGPPRSRRRGSRAWFWRVQDGEAVEAAFSHGVLRRSWGGHVEPPAPKLRENQGGCLRPGKSSSKNSSMGGRVGRPRVLAFSAGWSRMKRCGRAGLSTRFVIAVSGHSVAKEFAMRVVSRSKLLLAVLLLVLSAGGVETSRAQSSLNPGFAEGDAAYEPKARAGREIWFFATAYNDRFFTYSYPATARRRDRLVQDPGGEEQRATCSRPGGSSPTPTAAFPADPDCPAKTLEETYGFQWCPGDAELLSSSARRDGYRDPACDFKDAPFDAPTPHGASDQRQSPCDLQFGTSTGALGLRKFPNPRFDAETWLEAERLARELGGLRQAACRAIRTTANPAEPALRRLGRAAVPDRHGLRRLPHRLRSAASRRPIPSIRDGRTSTAWSATSTAASRSILGLGHVPASRWSGS